MDCPLAVERGITDNQLIHIGIAEETQAEYPVDDAVFEAGCRLEFIGEPVDDEARLRKLIMLTRRDRQAVSREVAWDIRHGVGASVALI